MFEHVKMNGNKSTKMHARVGLVTTSEENDSHYTQLSEIVLLLRLLPVQGYILWLKLLINAPAPSPIISTKYLIQKKLEF